MGHKSRPFPNSPHATNPKTDYKNAGKASLPISTISPASRSGQSSSASNYVSNKNTAQHKAAPKMATFDDYYGNTLRVPTAKKKYDDSVSGDSDHS